MTKTTSFADCRRFATNIQQAGGKLPQPLQNLLQAHDVLTDSTPPATAPETAIVDHALAGTLTAEKLAELLPPAAIQHMTIDYSKQLARDTERVLLGAWHRAIGKGGAEAILTSMRPQFDRHAKEILAARALFNVESDAEAVLSSAPSEVVEAWQGLQDHITAVGRIVLVAREFGCKPTAQFPQITELANADNFRLSDEALMCADGGLEQESSYFQRPDRGHRTSPLFRVSLRLHSVESARERYRVWAEQQWDASHSGPQEHYLIDGKMVPVPRPENPYRTKASVT